MIKFKLFNIEFKISFLFLFFVAWILLYDENNIFLIYLCSSIFHELFHILFLQLCSTKIECITLTVFGFSLKKANELNFLKEILVLISGCLGNLLLILIFLYFKITIVVLINILILIFNILPFEKLDGGQIFRMLLERFFNFKISYLIYSIVSKIAAIFFLIATVFLGIYHKNFNILLMFILFAISYFTE